MNAPKTRAARIEAGFTLIEVLVTISIIGILAAIAAFSVTTMRARSVKQACASDIRTTQLALDSYKTKYGSYASNVSALTSGGVITRLDDSGEYDIGYAATPAPYTLTVTKKGVPQTPTITSTSSKADIESACD